MKKQYYFKRKTSEICKTKEYFIKYMQRENLTEIKVFKAVHEIIGNGIFWCKEHSFCGDDSTETCGKNNCDKYIPKNKINGVCKYHTHWLYVHGKEIILTLDNINLI